MKNSSCGWIRLGVKTPPAQKSIIPQALATIEESGLALSAAISNFDYTRGMRPSLSLHELMKKIALRYTYAVLYLPDASSEEYLWRYQGPWPSDTYEKDRGVRRIAVENDLEQAIQKALKGDSRAIDQINLDSKATYQSVIVGQSGRPKAVLRLVKRGRGGTERDIR